MIRFSVCFFIILICFPSSVFSISESVSEKGVYTQALLRLDEEYKNLKKTYSDIVLSQLDKKSFRNKTYRNRLGLIYSGIKAAKNILISKIEKLNDRKAVFLKKVIYIDPGHGGADPGATVPPVRKDKNADYLFAESRLTFEIAQIIKNKLERLGYFVVLSRDKVTDGPSLYARSALCRAINPDISVSVHLNSTRYAYPVYDDPKTAFPKIDYTRAYVWGPTGFDFFYPFYLDRHNEIVISGSRKKSIKLASFIVKSFKTGLGVNYSLSEEDSFKLARVKQLRDDLKRTISKNMETKLPVAKSKYDEDISLEKLNKNKTISRQYQDDLKNYDGVDGKDLHMVRETPSIPSVLLEAVFLSSPEEQYLFDRKNRVEQIANAIVAGIENYFREE